MSTTDSLFIRRAEAGDLPTVIDVCRQALQWSDGGVDEAFFRWKHVDNVFGPSPIWVAEDRSATTGSNPPSIVGVRAMMRWQLRDGLGEIRDMVRAVDTATLPSHQGKGIFSKLTMAAVDELTDAGVSAVFNTPNDKSRPGYLKMGWHQVGRVPVKIQPRSPLTIPAMVRSKVAAEKWGIETDVGLDPGEALAESGPVETALRASPSPTGWATPLTVDYLRWRTAFAPLASRILPIGSTLEDGFLVFRLRRRGQLRQASLLHLVGSGDSGRVRRLVRRLLKQTAADVVMSSGREPGLIDGLVPLPGAGPLLTWRPLANPTVPGRSDLDIALGAIELF